MAVFKLSTAITHSELGFPFQNLIWNFKVIKEAYSKTSTVALKLRIYKGTLGLFSL